MESLDHNASYWTPDSSKIKELEERIDMLEQLYILHIHDVNEILGVTDIPRRPSSNSYVVEAVNHSVYGKRKKK